jgi:hypothetical protein
MKTLDVSAMGLQEMNRSEMIQTEGGLIGLIIAAVVAVVALSSCGSYKQVDPSKTPEETDKEQGW